jgi:hypothetical protein
MKNEALETHCVKEVKLLAYPIKNEERIYHTPSNDFFLCENHHELTLDTADPTPNKLRILFRDFFGCTIPPFQFYIF